MNNLTTMHHPMQLKPGRVVTHWPDELLPEGITTLGQPGEWTVRADPRSYGEYVRVDVRDTQGRDHTWVLHTKHRVAVRLTRRENIAKAVAVAARLACAALPEVYAWVITEEGVNAQLRSTTSDARADLRAWQEQMGGEVTEEPAGAGVRVTATSEVSGVPVRVWSVVYQAAPQPPAPATAETEKTGVPV